MILPRLQYPRFASLVAVHADVVGQPAREPGGVDDRPVRAASSSNPLCALLHVQLPGSMTVLAANGRLLEWRIAIEAVSLADRLRLPAVTNNAAGQDWPAEAVVVELVAG